MWLEYFYYLILSLARSQTSDGDDALLREFVDTFSVLALLRPVSGLLLNLTGGSVIILDSVTATHSMVAGAARGTLSKIIKSGDLKQK